MHIRKFYLCLIVLILFLMPLDLRAYCSQIEKYQESSYLSDIAANVMFATFYDEKDGEIEFNIQITNLHPNIMLYEERLDANIYYDATRTKPLEYNLSGLDANQTLRFMVSPRNSRCLEDNEILLIRHVTIPGYNPYYDDPLCKGLSSFLLCQRWHHVDIEYEEFVERVEEYQRRIAPDDDDDEIEENIISLFGLIREYYLHIAVLFGIIILGLLLRKRIKRDDFKL